MVIKGCGKQIDSLKEGYYWYTDWISPSWELEDRHKYTGWHLYRAGEAKTRLICGNINSSSQPWLCIECGDKAGVMW